MKRLLGLFVSMVLVVCLITGFSGCGKDKTPEEDKTLTEENDKQNDKPGFRSLFDFFTRVIIIFRLIVFHTTSFVCCFL